MNTKDSIAVQALKKYNSLINKAEVLAYELRRPTFIGSGEIIECLSFPGKSSDSVRRSSGHSNRTHDIALKYEDLAKQANNEVYMEILREYYLVFVELERIELYVRQLDTELNKIISLHYFDGIKWEDVQKQLNLTPRTLFRMCRKALAELEEKFLLAQKHREQIDLNR